MSQRPTPAELEDNEGGTGGAETGAPQLRRGHRGTGGGHGPVAASPRRIIWALPVPRPRTRDFTLVSPSLPSVGLGSELFLRGRGSLEQLRAGRGDTAGGTAR